LGDYLFDPSDLEYAPFMTTDPKNASFEFDRSIEMNEFQVELPEMTDADDDFNSFIIESETLGNYSSIGEFSTFESFFVQLELLELKYLIKFSIPESQY
jgi:hypothetical protein